MIEYRWCSYVNMGNRLTMWLIKVCLSEDICERMPLSFFRTDAWCQLSLAEYLLSARYHARHLTYICNIPRAYKLRISTFILRMTTLSLWRVRWHACFHVAHNWQGQDCSLGLADAQAHIIPTVPWGLSWNFSVSPHVSAGLVNLLFLNVVVFEVVWAPTYSWKTQAK